MGTALHRSRGKSRVLARAFAHPTARRSKSSRCQTARRYSRLFVPATRCAWGLSLSFIHHEVTSCPLPHPLLSPFSRRLAPDVFVFPPRYEGLVSATGATDACEAPGIACHDRHAGALFRRLAFPLKRKRSPCGAPPWRFCGPCPCFPLSGIPSGAVRRPSSPHGSYCPEDRVSWTSTRYGVCAGRGRHTSLHIKTPHEAPLDERG